MVKDKVVVVTVAVAAIYVVCCFSAKVKVHTLDIAPLLSISPLQKRSCMALVLKGFQFYLHTHMSIHNQNEPYLPLPSQLQLVLIYRPRRDGGLCRRWCEAR